MPRQVQNPRASDDLTREFNIQGRMDLRVDETIVPVKQIADARRIYFAAEAQVAAGGAGFRSIVVVNNQSLNRSDEVWIHRIQFSDPAGALLHYVVRPSAVIAGLAANTNVSPLRFEDGAAGAGVVSTWETRNGAAVPPGTIIRSAYTPGAGGSTIIDFDPFPIRLVGGPPNTAVTERTVFFCPFLDNQALLFSAVWSEPPRVA